MQTYQTTWSVRCAETRTSLDGLTSLSMLIGVPAATIRPCENICPICRKSFRDAFGLEQHRAVHSFRRPFKCTKCNKAFKQLGHLTHHMHVHASEGKFRCPQCNKKLSSRQNFDSHFAVHLDKKSFCCPVCKEWFRAQSNLYNHLKSHRLSGETLVAYRRKALLPADPPQALTLHNNVTASPIHETAVLTLIDHS